MAGIPVHSSRLRFNTIIDQQGILAMAGSFEKSLPRAEKFAERFIVRAIREEVLDSFVRRLCARAGAGWPEIYTDHLVTVLRTVPITVQGGAQILGDRSVGDYGTKSVRGIDVSFNLESLGDYNDFEAGAHYKALLAQGGEENHPPSAGLRNHGKSGEHHGMNPHPARVNLPYGNEDLMNDVETRKEFFEQVIVGGDLSFPLQLRKGKGVWTLEEHMQRMGYEVSTLNETYLARVIAWGSKAPQWLLLQNGSDAIMHGSIPKVNSVDFYFSIQRAAICIATQITTSVIHSLIKQAQEQGVRLGRTGLPYEVIPGRGASFAPYKEITDFEIGNYQHCFGAV